MDKQTNVEASKNENLPESSNVLTQQKCIICGTENLPKIVFYQHLLGKRHLKSKKKLNDLAADSVSAKKTLCVRGIPHNGFIEVLNEFWNYGLVDASLINTFCFIEFRTREDAEKACTDPHVIQGKLLKVDFKKPTKIKNPNTAVEKIGQQNQLVINKNLLEKMYFINPEMTVDLLLLELVDEIQLTAEDYKERDKLRFIMETFLRPMFPVAKTYVFGSSANNLGFVGCDVDMYADFGFSPWSYGTKDDMENRAADLTRYLAKEIRKRRRGYDVVAIPKARVPIVKFKDCSNDIAVDLSFKSPMPICNTALIKVYTTTHSVVRPYLMVLRYWAKLQEVAGGGHPDTLLTNYCFTMLMLFWLMNRNPPIVPSVAELKEELYFSDPRLYKAVVVDGWDCSFSENVNEWIIQHHAISLTALIQEFFQFYAKLDADEWVISPLVGSLISRIDLAKQDPRFLPTILHPYCNVRYKIQVNTAFCVQDPFEHNHNIARGLKYKALTMFQAKCHKAAQICEQIRNGEACLGQLFEPIELDEKEILLNRANRQANLVKETVNKADNVITDINDDDDSDIQCLYEVRKGDEVDIQEIRNENRDKAERKRHLSTDGDHGLSDDENIIRPKIRRTDDNTKNEKSDDQSIAVCDEEKKQLQDAGDDSKTDPIRNEIINLNQEDEIWNEILDPHEEEDEILQADADKIVTDGRPDELSQSAKNEAEMKVTDETNISAYMLSPVEEFYKFKLYFNSQKEFTIKDDGQIVVSVNRYMTVHQRENMLKCVIKFILEKCLMCSVEELQLPCTDKEKGRSLSKGQLDNFDPEPIETSRKECATATGSITTKNFTVLCSLKCISTLQMWEKRNLFYRKLGGLKAQLFLEKAASDFLIREIGREALACKQISTYNVCLWKDTVQPGTFYVTWKLFEQSNSKPRIAQFFTLFKRIVNDVVEYIENVLKQY